MPHIVITGASRRLGLTLVSHFLDQNWRVTAISRDASAELSALESDHLSVLLMNYQDEQSVLNGLQTLTGDTVDLLLHNASYFEKDKALLSDTSEQLTAMMNVHVRLPMLMNETLTPALQRAGNPNIIHMSDIYVLNPAAEYGVYCASKAALENLSMSYAKKLAPQIRVNTIQPGALMFLPDHSEAEQKAVLSQSLLQKASGFQPIVETIEYIMNNTFLTGSALKVDGGRSLCR